MKKINIGLLGFGTVGTGVAKLLINNNDVLQSRLGADLVLKHAADIDIASDRGIALEPGVLVTDAHKVVEDPDINIIVEMIGGETIAKELILKAIDQGKHVVTANKALLATQGGALFEAAAQKGVDLAFEASVGGCMPVVKTLRESLVGNRVHAMTGILNGTCNYILSKISDLGSPFKRVLAEAQARGYAEADPTLDVEGLDAAHKVAILAALAYGTKVNFDDIYVEGITAISPIDFEFAAQFGYRIKLLGISKDRGNGIEARVHPTMIPSDNLLSKVTGTVNALNISADAVGEILLHGRGAGMMPTASAVISDIGDVARNLLTGSAARVPLMAFQQEALKEIPIVPIEELETHYYFRFSAVDRPGVLSTISGVLGTHGISLKSVHQKGRKTNGSVPLVMLTHHARELEVRRALTELESLDVVSKKPVLIRIEEDGAPD